MKLACLFYGQPRFLENKDAYRSIKELIIDRYNADVYCHMWYAGTRSHYGHNDAYSAYGRGNGVGSWSGLKDTGIHPEAFQMFHDMYYPKQLVAEYPRNFQFDSAAREYLDANFTDKHPNWTHDNYSNMLSQLYSISAVCKMFTYGGVNDNKSYEWTLLLRPDLVFEDFPDLSRLERGKLYVDGRYGPGSFPAQAMLFDWAASTWAMKLYEDTLDVSHAWPVEQPIPEMFQRRTLQTYGVEVAYTSMWGQPVRSS